jgi:hypothetical protein
MGGFRGGVLMSFISQDTTKKRQDASRTPPFAIIADKTILGLYDKKDVTLNLAFV